MKKHKLIKLEKGFLSKFVIFLLHYEILSYVHAILNILKYMPSSYIYISHMIHRMTRIIFTSF